MPLEFDLSKINFSGNDINRAIRLPSCMTKELAEEIGIFMGDGSLNIYDYKNRGKYWLQFSGNTSEELNYYKTHVTSLLRSLFNHAGNIIKLKKDNSFLLRIYSKAIIEFKIKVLELPFGPKSHKIFIPDIVLKDKDLLSAFLRGLADTDFSLTFKRKYKDVHYYPVLKADSKSESLIKQLHSSLKDFNIKSDMDLENNKFDPRTKKTYTIHTLYISGENNLRIWMNSIGFSNPAYYTKYLVWKKFGFCPPRTKLIDRMLLLNNKVEISKFAPQ